MRPAFYPRDGRARRRADWHVTCERPRRPMRMPARETTVTRSDAAAVLPVRLAIALGAAAALVAAAHTWTYRFRLVNLDSVSYLDIADAWRTAGWRAAINGYWSP